MQEMLVYDEEIFRNKRDEAKFFYAALSYPGEIVGELELSIVDYAENNIKTTYLGTKDTKPTKEDFQKFCKAYCSSSPFLQIGLVMDLDTEGKKRVTLMVLPLKLRQALPDQKAFVIINYTNIDDRITAGNKLKQQIMTEPTPDHTLWAHYSYTPSKKEQDIVNDLINYMVEQTVSER